MMLEIGKLIPFIDLTSLKKSETEADILDLCQRAQTNFGNVAAVCTYPEFIPLTKKQLSSTSIKICTVANFPQGSSDLKQTLKTIHESLEQGADEIDIVMPYHAFLKGESSMVFSFVAACKKACGSSILKVILETGVLLNPEKIYNASREVIAAGADFIKTSSGKVPINATLEAAEVMLKAIRDSRMPVGFKASGAVRTLEQMNAYYSLAEKILATPPTPARFRLGMSSIST